MAAKRTRKVSVTTKSVLETHDPPAMKYQKPAEEIAENLWFRDSESKHEAISKIAEIIRKHAEDE